MRKVPLNTRKLADTRTLSATCEVVSATFQPHSAIKVLENLAVSVRVNREIERAVADMSALSASCTDEHEIQPDPELNPDLYGPDGAPWCSFKRGLVCSNGRQCRNPRHRITDVEAVARIVMALCGRWGDG